MSLIERLRRGLAIGHELRKGALGAVAATQMTEQTFGFLGKGRVIDIAGGDDRHAGGPIITVTPGNQIVAVDRHDARCQNGTAGQLAAIGGRLGEIE
jgi:hypothetical protein